MAMRLLQQAREMLHILESEVNKWTIIMSLILFSACRLEYLAMLCYNLGLDLFQKKLNQHSVNWLKCVPHTHTHTHTLTQTSDEGHSEETTSLYKGHFLMHQPI